MSYISLSDAQATPHFNCVYIALLVFVCTRQSACTIQLGERVHTYELIHHHLFSCVVCNVCGRHTDVILYQHENVNVLFSRAIAKENTAKEDKKSKRERHHIPVPRKGDVSYGELIVLG